MPSPNVHTPAGAQRTGFRELTIHTRQRVRTVTDIIQRYPSSEPPPTSSVPTSTTDDSDTPASLLSPLLTLPTSLAGLKLGGFAFNGSPSKVAAPAATPAPPVGSDTSAVWQHVQLGPSPA